MELTSCKKCERAYSFDGVDLCPKCRYEDDADFKTVKEYLYENPGADIKRVEQDTGVSIKKILQYLKEGRITITEGSDNTALSCERCEKPINLGRYCSRCINEMKREFKGAIDDGKKAIEKKRKIESKEKDKMFVVERYSD